MRGGLHDGKEQRGKRTYHWSDDRPDPAIWRWYRPHYCAHDRGESWYRSRTDQLSFRQQGKPDRRMRTAHLRKGRFFFSDDADLWNGSGTIDGMGSLRIWFPLYAFCHVPYFYFGRSAGLYAALQLRTHTARFSVCLKKRCRGRRSGDPRLYAPVRHADGFSRRSDSRNAARLWSYRSGRARRLCHKIGEYAFWGSKITISFKVIHERSFYGFLTAERDMA